MAAVQKTPSDKERKCIYISNGLHTEIKIIAAKKGKSIQEYVEAAIKPAIKRDRCA